MKDILFLDLNKGEQKQILLCFKKELRITWDALAKILGVNRSMMFFYCNDTCKMPLMHVKKLCHVSGLDINEEELKTKELPNSRENIIFLPKCGEELAEFLGILSGDGCISKPTYITCVTCDALLDYSYVINVVSKMFSELFAITPKLRTQTGAIHCWVYSKMLFEFLSKNCEFPVGKKKNKLFVSKWISENPNYSIAFIRGLFDTDGGVHRHHKNSIQLGFTSRSKDFLIEVYDLMKYIGLNPRLSKYDIWFFGESALDFFEIVKPNNSKHIYKFNKFKETKIVPLSREMYAGAGS